MSIDAILATEDRRFYIGVLSGEECQCGRAKKRGRALCWGCYKRLPRDIQQDLYQAINAGFEAAYDEAVLYLNS